MISALVSMAAGSWLVSSAWSWWNTPDPPSRPPLWALVLAGLGGVALVILAIGAAAALSGVNSSKGGIARVANATRTVAIKSAETIKAGIEQVPVIGSIALKVLP